MNTLKDQLNAKAKTYSRSIICLLLAILLAVILPEYFARADGPTPGTVGYLASTPTPSSLKSLSTASSLASATSPLNKFNTWNLNGGYVAAGIGMRNRGYGTINISLPSGSSVKAAYLYWDILGTTADSSFAQGQFNKKAISGTLIGQGPDPCWGNSANFAYRADVTPLVTSSGTSYALSGFRSAITNGVDPWGAGRTAPMLEGASLVIIYQNPSSPMTQVQLYDGSFETEGATATLMIDGFTAPNPMVKAQTTFIGADGQTSADDLTTFNGTQFPNIWNGADPQAGAPFQNGNLWDTLTRDVTNLVTSGSTSATAGLQGTGDCLVWVAQAFSIQQSQPNPTPTPTNTPDGVTCGVLSAQSVVNSPSNGPHCRPHQDKQPSCPQVDTQLRSYDVTINFEGADPAKELTYCLEAVEAVQAIAARFGEATSTSDLTGKFRQIFGGGHTITFINRSGRCGDKDVGCDVGQLGRGAQIYIPTYKHPETVTDDQHIDIWIIHEFGHLLTNRTCGGSSSCSPAFNGIESIFNFAKVQQTVYLGISSVTYKKPWFNGALEAAEYITKNTEDDDGKCPMIWAIHSEAWAITCTGTTYPAELTADVFLYWVLHDTSSDPRYQPIEDFMNSLIGFCALRTTDACGFSK